MKAIIVIEQPHSRQADDLASMLWGLHSHLKRPTIGLLNDYDDPYFFLTIQKERPHGSGNKFVMLNAIFMHEIGMTFFQKPILGTYMVIPHISSPYYFQEHHPFKAEIAEPWLLDTHRVKW